MKKSLRKVIVTLSAVAALSLAMGATAMAAEAEAGAQLTGDGAVFTYKTPATVGDEVTVLLLKPEADTTDGIQETEIAYIDQKTAETAEVSFSMPVAGVTTGTTYKLMSGSSSATTATVKDVTVGSTSTGGDVKYGDVDASNTIDVFDALEMLKYASFMESVFDADKSLITVGDIDESGAVDVFDALEVLKFASFMDTDYDDTKFAWAK